MQYRAKFLFLFFFFSNKEDLKRSQRQMREYSFLNFVFVWNSAEENYAKHAPLIWKAVPHPILI